MPNRPGRGRYWSLTCMSSPFLFIFFIFLFFNDWSLSENETQVYFSARYPWTRDHNELMLARAVFAFHACWSLTDVLSEINHDSDADNAVDVTCYMLLIVASWLCVLKDKFAQLWTFSHFRLTPKPMESWGEFRSPPNISGAAQQNCNGRLSVQRVYWTAACHFGQRLLWLTT